MGERLSGEGFLRGLRCARERLSRQEQAINALNVFPVPDGDTGTNMLMTLTAAIQEVERAGQPASVGRAAQAAAKGSLLGARGNSGVILSQFMRGVARGLEGKASCSPGTLVSALERAVETACAAVIEPVEGTMLSVGRGAAEAARRAYAASPSLDIRGVLEHARRGAEEALRRTPEQLEVLRKSGVVDAGGQGLLALLEGCLQAFEEDPADEGARWRSSAASLTSAIPSAPGVSPTPPDGGGIHPAQLTYRYCTEFILKGTNLPEEELKRELAGLGDSLLVVGDSDLLKIHVHTNHPGRVLELATARGVLSQVSISNMQEQNEAWVRHRLETEFASPVSGPALVAVAWGTGFRELFRSLGVHGIVAAGRTMNPSTQQMAEVIARQAADTVIVLPNNPNVIPAARQAAELVTKQTGKVVRVLPVKSLQEGIAAVTAYTPGEDGGEGSGDIEALVDGMLQAARSVRTGEITVAARPYEADGHSVQVGEFIGMGDGVLRVSGPDRDEVALQLLAALGAEDAGIITIYYGEDVDSEVAEGLAARVRSRYPQCEVEVYRGDQPLYPYLLAVE